MTFWANTETGEVVSTEEMRVANPNTIFPIPFEPVDGYEPLDESPPTFDPATQRLQATATASKVNGKWTRAFAVYPLSQEEIDAIRKSKVPSVVTMRQARLALLASGLLGGVDAAIEALPSPDKEAARIEWEYSQEVERSNGLVPLLAAQLGISENDLDNLFIQAATL